MIQNHPERDFHVYVLIPMMPEGAGVPATLNANPGIRALEWQTIGFMIKEVRNAAQGIKKRWDDYLTFCCLMRSDASGENTTPDDVNNWHTLDTTARMDLCRLNQRYMVYIHCKLMIVDDRYLILGSANANERSMAGDRDTEICVALWPANNQVRSTCETKIGELRQKLLKEHMGLTSPPTGWATPESPGFRKDQFQTLARSNYRSLFLPKGGGGMQGHLVMLPFDVTSNGSDRVPPDWFTDEEKKGERHEYLFDSLRNHEQWKWRSDLNTFLGKNAGSALIE